MKMSIVSDCNLSCDLANPQRSPVPGLESVKSATEDTTGVGDQASVAVNAIGRKNVSQEVLPANKKLVQQAFHPSLFLPRARSSSVSDLPTTGK